MLLVDPLKRATVEEIETHEWFQKDLPAYLFPSPVESDSSIIELLAISEVCEKFGVQEIEVHNAFLSGDPHDQLAIAYHLVIDNRRIDETAKSEIKDFYIASTSPPPIPIAPPVITDLNSIKPHPERITPLRERATQQVSSSIYPGGTTVASVVGPENNRGTPVVKRAKWHLGIRSQSKPNDIMLEVYRAMKALDYEWKVLNPYHVRKMNKDGNYVKMSLQLYQVDLKSYPVDFKSLTKEEVEPSEEVAHSLTPPSGTGTPRTPQISGHHMMEFFELCAQLIVGLAREVFRNLLPVFCEEALLHL